MRDHTPGALIDRAVQATGLRELGSGHFEIFLRAWCADLARVELSETGREFLSRQAQRNLELRLRLIDTLRRHPEIGAVPLPPIVRIVGFPRSGTTLLHNLMALHPRARALLRWELVHPLPPPEAATWASDPRIERTRRSLEALRGGELERMHWVEATDPEECTWGFFDGSGLMGRGCSGLMRAWSDAVYDRSQPHRETYAEYRALLQLLLWRNPLPEHGMLVLKCPTDVGHLRTFLEVFPEARLVLCHRDPYRTVTSSAKMAQVICGPFVSPSFDWEAFWLHEGALGTQAPFADAMQEIAREATGRVTSVRYADLMRDPGEGVARAYEALGIDPERDAIVSAVERFTAGQRAGGRAAPPGELGSFGYTPERVRTHPSMSRYMERFGVPAEDVRIAAPRR